MDKVLGDWIGLCSRKKKLVQTSRVRESVIWGKYLRCKEMQSFIVENLRGEVIDVYCGGPDVFSGSVESCADNVLCLEQNGRYTYIAMDKIIAVWRAQTP